MLGLVAASAGALMAVGPEAESSRPSVLLVEMGRLVGDRGLYTPPDMPPDAIPWDAYVVSEVRPVRAYAGRRHASPVLLEYVAHAGYVPGLVMLVIAEPSRHGRGLFARWYTVRQDGRGRYCVPEPIVAELDVRRAFRGARRVTDEGRASLCIRSDLVTRD